MVKGFLRALSYLLAILVGVMLTLVVLSYQQKGTAKLEGIYQLITSAFIGEYDETQVLDAAADAMIRSLGDRWSYYMPAESFKSYVEQSNNAYVGIGITISADIEGRGFLVDKVESLGSAYEAGMLPGDIITGVNQIPAAGLDMNGIRSIIRGDEGTMVKISVLRNQSEFTIDVERKHIQIPVADGSMYDSQIGIIRIHNFDSRCSQDSIACIKELIDQGAQSIIFDVRNNPGGYADELISLLDYLLPAGEIFRTVDYTGKVDIEYSDDSCILIPIAVLCNGNSYSAAEFFAAAIQEYQAGIIIGEPTCGKGYFQYVYPLRDGSAVDLSVGKYYTPKGKSLTDIGITPDIEIVLEESAKSALIAGTLPVEEDPQMMAAIEFLQNAAYR